MVARQRGPHRRERGQGTGEFAGVVTLAAITVAAVVLAVTASSPAMRDTVVTTICQITTLGQGDCGETSGTAEERGDGELPWYLDPSMTPEQRATQGSYVALGDSFSSGEGGTDYEDGTDENNEASRDAWERTHDEDGNRTCNPNAPGANSHNCPSERPYHNMCHRSAGAYPQRLNEQFTFAGGLDFMACSGAVTGDFTEPNADNDGEAAQLDHLDENTSLVTLSIGGNDANFASTLKDCIYRGLNPFSSCSEDAEQVQADLQAAHDNLEELLPQIREQAPNARILIVGYPRFFPEEELPGYSDGTVIDPEDKRFINDMVDEMNQGIEDLVTEYNDGSSSNNIEYVDVSDAFDGCEIGTSEPCMNNVQVWNDGSLNTNGSYHPNDRGHERYSEILEEAITHGP